jgi:hypothetical protein
MQNKVESEKSVVFVGLARDCAQHLLYVLDNIHLIAGLFGRAAYLFAENDSKDATPQILHVFRSHQPDCRVLNFDGIATKLPERTRRFAYLRNHCLSLVRADKKLHSYDYLVVLDMDDSCTRPLEPESLAKAFRFLDETPEAAGVFANCRGIYYDMWALRHGTLCPGDVWEDQLDFVLTHQVDDLAAYKATFEPRLFSLAETAPPLEVESAFGGLGIYKMRYALRAAYKGQKSKEVVQGSKRRRFRLQVCEHVHYNRDIRQQGGKLYILPFLINRVTEGIEFSETAYRSLIF